MMKKNKTALSLVACLLLMLFFVASCNPPADDESKYSGSLFTENIRTTDPLTPEEERMGFKLPPGFEIQLFASEPNIDKPINMTFDAKGRMWVTQSFEYPFPTPAGFNSTDKLTILEDTDHDGRADKFTQISDTLNIPIGVLPVQDGVLAFSVPNLYKFNDTDGDYKPENKKVMLGPFGFQDTHGMVSNFTRGYDGWVYACHGFTNFSKVAGADGDSITLISGNTFRFRLDGSRAEQMTFGQVNPFGLAYDENGYIYSTDSHTSPLHQLIRGGDYPHFSKPEIMAFGPDMKSFENEATALCGIAYYGDTKFPEEFQGNFFIGDAVSSRVHRYTWQNKGSSPVGKSEIDFIKSSDPWFRPVNVKLGPDGALYVADFYNAIIGHYEVPLGHPKRDKKRGRIWRITYKGDHHLLTDLTVATIEELISAFDKDNITTRMAAADQLADRIGETAIEPLKAVLKDANTSPIKYSHALWVLFRVDAMNDEILTQSLSHASPTVRLHTLRILRERKQSKETFHPIIIHALKDTDPRVQRAAVELITDYPEMTSVNAVLEILHNTPPHDTHLVYTSRLILRNLLRNNMLMKQVAATEWNTEEAGFIAGTLVDVQSAEAAMFLNKFLADGTMPKGKTQLAYQQIGRFIPQSQLESIIQKAQAGASNDVEFNTQIFRGLKDGLAQRGAETKGKIMTTWGSEIAERILKTYHANYDSVTDEILSQQHFAIELAGEYKVKSTTTLLSDFIRNKKVNVDVKANALKTLIKISPDKTTLDIASQILTSSTASNDLKKRVAVILGESPSAAVNEVLMGVKKAPADLEAAIATALAGSPEGKTIVLNQIKNGAFMSRTLIDPRVEERMLLGISAAQRTEFDQLIAGIEPISEERQSLIDERLKAFKQFKQTSALQLDSGGAIYNENCNVCHRRYTLSGIGPQLHGIGKRGAEALAEKILDPNRNISEAFRNYTINLKDGKVLSGIFRREEGEVLIFGDLSGKEYAIPKNNIASQTPSRYTIMPDHFGSTLSQQQFNLLVNYLLTW